MDETLQFNRSMDELLGVAKKNVPFKNILIIYYLPHFT